MVGAELAFATAKLGAIMAPVNHRLDHAVITDVLMGYSPTVVVAEQTAAGVSLPPGVGSHVVVGTTTGAEAAAGVLAGPITCHLDGNQRHRLAP